MKEFDSFYLSEKQIEELKRKRIWNKKMANSAKYILIGVAGFITTILLEGKLGNIINVSSDVQTLIESAAALIGSGGIIIGGMKFAAAIHEPLTEKEAQEYKQKENEEKGRKL